MSTKIPNSHFGGGRGVVVGVKFAKIQNSHVEGGVGGLMETNFQLLMLSSNLLKSKIPMSSEGGGGGALWKPISNF